MNTEYISNPVHHTYIIFDVVPEDVLPNRREGVYVVRLEGEMSVNDVRLLREYGSQATDGTRKVVISASSMTLQAQNALLKMLEETAQGIHFFIYLQPGVQVIDTLASRCYIIENADSGDGQISSGFKAFVDATARERLELIDGVWSKERNIRNIEILRLLQDFEQYIHQKIKTSPEKEHQSLLRCRGVLISARNALHTGGLHKGTLQSLAFV